MLFYIRKYRNHIQRNEQQHHTGWVIWFLSMIWFISLHVIVKYCPIKIMLFREEEKKIKNYMFI